MRHHSKVNRKLAQEIREVVMAASEVFCVRENLHAEVVDR